MIDAHKDVFTDNEFQISYNGEENFINRLSINDIESIDGYDFWISGGKYYAKTIVKNKQSTIKLSNCTFRFLYNIDDGSNDTTRVMLLQKYTGQKFLLEVKSSQLKPDAFGVLLNSYGCMFNAQVSILKDIFTYLFDHEKNAVGLYSLGYNAEYNIFVYTDCIITPENEIIKADEFGIIEYLDKAFYLPAYSMTNINNEDFESLRKYSFRAGVFDFEAWAKLYYQAYGIKAAIAIQFSILCLFRDIVFNHVGFFPYLFLFGKRGTGKTQFVKKMLFLFGNDDIGIAINNSTYVGISRAANQRVNSMMYLKEYSREIEGKIEDFILTGYDGAGRLTGTFSNDNKTKEKPIKSGIVFDGNELPADKAAVYSRMILLIFDSDIFNESQTNAFNELKKIDKGLGNVALELLKQRKIISERFKIEYNKIYTELKKDDRTQGMADRTVSHIALVCTPQRILSEKLIFPVEYNELVNSIVEFSREQNQILQEIEDTTIFWRSFTQYHDKLLLNIDKHFKIEKPYCFIDINIDSVYSKCYTKYCQQSRTEPLIFSSLKKMLTNDNYPPFVIGNRKDSVTTNVAIGNTSRSFYRFKFPIQNDEINIEGILVNYNDLETPLEKP